MNERVSLFTLHLVAELRRTERADKEERMAVEVSHMDESMQVEASLPYPGVSEG